MRKSSYAPPPGALRVDSDGVNSDKVLLKFFENAQMIEPQKYWVYDEYHIILDVQDYLAIDISTGYAALLQRAKEDSLSEDYNAVNADILFLRLENILSDIRYDKLPDWVKLQIEHLLDP